MAISKFNAGVARNPRETTAPEQKMGLPPAHTKKLSDVPNPESRWRLSQIFCGRVVQNRKNVVQFPPLGYGKIKSLKHVSMRL